jgi:hypothetical protein
MRGAPISIVSVFFLFVTDFATAANSQCYYLEQSKHAKSSQLAPLTKEHVQNWAKLQDWSEASTARVVLNSLYKNSIRSASLLKSLRQLYVSEKKLGCASAYDLDDGLRKVDLALTETESHVKQYRDALIFLNNTINFARKRHPDKVTLARINNGGLQVVTRPR